jgi:chaperonin GroES
VKVIKELKPLGHRVLIKPDDVNDTSKGGIYLGEDLKKQEQGAQVIGTVLDIGDTCWLDTPSGEPWCSVGDRVVFAKYSGMKIWNPVEGKYRDDILIVNDLDITALITLEDEVDV